MIVWFTGPKYDDMVKLVKELQLSIPSVALYFHDFKDGAMMARTAKYLEAQTPVIVCGGAATEAKRYEISDLCNPTWVYIKRKIRTSTYETPKPLKDVFMLNQDISFYDSIRRIRYFIGATPQEPCTMLIGDFHPLTDEMIAQIKALGDNVVLALRDVRITPKNPRVVPAYRLQALKREFGESVKIIVIPYAKEILRERAGILTEVCHE